MFRMQKHEAPEGAPTGSASVPTPPATPAPALDEARITKLISDVVAEALVAERSRTKATANAAGLGDADDEPRVITSNQRHATEAVKGLGFVRFLKASALAARVGGTPVDRLREWSKAQPSMGYAEIATQVERHGAHMAAVAKALGQSVFADGGAMVPPQFSTEFIELLRNTTVVRRAGARSIPLQGTLTIPKQTAAGTASYIGENQPITPSQQSLGGITLSEKTLVALTVVANRLIANASISAEQFVLDDLRTVMGLREDTAFLFGDGAQDTPRGLTSLITSGHQYDATASAPKVPTLAELRVEFAKAIGKLKTANIPMVKPTWLMSPRTEQFLMGVTDGNGNAVYESQLEKGVLRGYPVIVSNQIPDNLGNTAGTGSDWSRLILVDASQEIIGDAEAMEAVVVPNGTYEESGSAKSGLARDQTVVRLIARHDHNVRHTGCAVVVAVEWGAP